MRNFLDPKFFGPESKMFTFGDQNSFWSKNVLENGVWLWRWPNLFWVIKGAVNIKGGQVRDFPTTKQFNSFAMCSYDQIWPENVRGQIFLKFYAYKGGANIRGKHFLSFFLKPILVMSSGMGNIWGLINARFFVLYPPDSHCSTINYIDV